MVDICKSYAFPIVITINCGLRTLQTLSMEHDWQGVQTPQAPKPGPEPPCTFPKLVNHIASGTENRRPSITSMTLAGQKSGKTRARRPPPRIAGPLNGVHVRVIFRYSVHWHVGRLHIAAVQLLIVATDSNVGYNSSLRIALVGKVEWMTPRVS